MLSMSAGASRFVALSALVIAGATAGAQDTEYIKSVNRNAPQLYVFTDTTSARIEYAVPGGKIAAGTKATAEIRSAKDSSILWRGEIGEFRTDAQGTARLAGQVKGLHPKYWSPQSPSLYRISVDAPGVKAEARIGFRTVTARNGQILLNGRPIFLKGNAINPPERNIPDSLGENRSFVEAYVKYLKSVNVNIIRLTRHSQVWFDVCDELGMMLFQGNYGTPQGGKATAPPTRPFEQSLAWYKNDVIGPLVNHPSVTVYVLSNEQADKEIGYLSTGAEEVGRFLKQAYDSVHAWDPTRVYIANAGYGFGRAGDLCDLHRYWGWYYNSFLSFYTMRYPATCWRTGVAQPMTMTENTGNYTGPDGRFNLVSNTKQPDSQLNWTGHAPNSEQSARALAYQAWMGGQAIEIFRRSREQNPNLAGLTPFTILFGKWHGISKFEDMNPKPLGKQYGVSYQPVLLSWENWMPQVYAGATIHPVVHLVNDSEDGANLSKVSVTWTLCDSGDTERAKGSTTMPDLPYYAAESKALSITIPAGLPTGEYWLEGTAVSNGQTVSHNKTRIFIARPDWGGRVTGVTRSIRVLDPSGKSLAALRRTGAIITPVTNVRSLDPARDLLVLGADAWSPALARDTTALRAFIARGGRLLVLHQDFNTFDGSWLPVPIRLQKSELDHALVFPGGRPFRNGMAVNPERPGHPALEGIDRDRLFLWDDFTNWNETKPGFPQVYPVTRGFVATNPATLGRAAILANYDHGLEGIALAELFDEKGGSAMVSGFDLVSRSGVDPVADRMLANLVRYMGSADAHVPTQLVADRITWGDYASEHGLVTGVYNGLLVNTEPVVPADLKTKYPVTVDAQGFWFAGGTSGWNTKPAIQYEGKGRRPFGPYTFTTGGSLQVDKAAGNTGEGRVWLRIPEGRTTMLTTIQNPAADALELELTVNGAPQRVKIPAGQTITAESTVKGGAQPLLISFRGDRRLVLVSTEFR